jgi:chemotaxis protein MotB
MTEIDENESGTESDETVEEPAAAAAASPTPAPTQPPEPDPIEPDSEPEPPGAAARAPEAFGEETTAPGSRAKPRVVPAPVKPPEAFVLETATAQPSGAGVAPQRPPFFALVPWFLLVIALVALGFVVARLYMPAVADLETRTTELEAARKDASILKRQVETLESLHKELAAKVAKRESEVQALQATQDELSERLQKEIKRGEVAISQARGELVVDLIDKILFDSGEAELNEKGAEVLRQVGETLLKVPDKIIQVTGHTDAMPISDKLKGEFPSNWELSTQRATNVVRFLQDEVKVPGERLAAAGRSQYKPVASNSTSRGRRRNRRIEVTLLPLAPGR